MIKELRMRCVLGEESSEYLGKFSGKFFTGSFSSSLFLLKIENVFHSEQVR